MELKEMAEALRAAGWRVQEPLKNCSHTNRSGSGINMPDGSGYWEWWCPDCDARERRDFPPRKTA